MYGPNLVNTAYDHYCDKAIGSNCNNVSDGETSTASSNYYIQNFKYIAIDYGAGNEKIIEKLRLYLHNGNAYTEMSEVGVVFQGSNNSTDGTDGDWTTLYTMNGNLPNSGFPGWTEDTFENDTSYRWYRISGTDAVNNTVLCEWEMMETVSWLETSQLWDAAESSDSGTGGYTYRHVVDTSNLSGTASKIRIKAGGSGAAFAASGVWIGHIGTSDYDFDGNQVEVKWDGSSGVSLDSGETAWSDPITIDLDNTKKIVISAYITGTFARSPNTGDNGGNDTTYWKDDSGASVGDTAPSGYAEANSTHRSKTHGLGDILAVDGGTSSWAKRIQIDIDSTKIDSLLTDFPLLIHLSTASGASNGDVSDVFDELTSDANRKKIAVTTSDGRTQCYVEIEKWDDANEEAWLWVKVPSILDGVDTSLYLYYDSSKDDNTSYIGDRGDTPAQNVWSAFELRFDMEDGTSSTVVDSTGNGHTGDKSGADQPEEAEQIIAKGQDFSAGDYIDIPDAPSDYFSGSWSIEGMYRNLAANEVLFTCGGGVSSWTDSSGFYFYAYGHPTVYANRMTCYYRISGDWEVLVSDVTYADDTWYHFALTWDGTTIKLYINGALKDSDTGLIAPTTYDLLTIGIDASDYSTNPLTGQVDEVRIATSALSDAWIKATYYSNIDNLVKYDVDPSELGDLLIHSDDSDGDTTFTNSGFGSAVISAAGDAHHEVDQSKFGASSIQFDGTGDYLTVSDNIIAADQDTFTIDCWIYPTASNTDSGRALVIGDSHVTQATSYWSFGRDTNDKLVFRWWDGSAKAAVSTNTISLNGWTHIAVCVDSGSIKLFINGTEETLSGTTTLTNRTGTLGYLTVGQAYTNGFTGYIDELRLYDGVAWWDSNFTPRSTPWGAAIETTIISAPIQFDFQVAAHVSGGRIITAAPVQFDFRLNAVIFKLWGHKLNGVPGGNIESLFEESFAFKYVEKINGV